MSRPLDHGFAALSVQGGLLPPEFLRSIECDRAQGYFIGRPMLGTALEVSVREWNARQ